MDYLRRIKDRTNPAALLLEPKFLAAQDLFFSTLAELGGTVDFDIADMREVHAVAALGDVRGTRVLDVGCGSTEPYVLEDTFRDRYPPLLAEMLQKLGADVTGVDIRPNPSARYKHVVADCTRGDWTHTLDPPYDIVTCLSLFNAPKSPFLNDSALCDRIIGDLHRMVSPEGTVIVTLRDDLFDSGNMLEERVSSSMQSAGFFLLHLDGNCAWLRHR